MTATIVIKQTNAVHMLTDGLGQWRTDRSFGPWGCKAWTVPHLNAVVASRGVRLRGLLITEGLSLAGRTYDEVKARAVQTLSASEGSYEAYWKALFGDRGDPFAAMPRLPTENADQEVVIAGWSETCGPDAYALSLDDQGRWSMIAGSPPMFVAPCDHVIQERSLAVLAPHIKADHNVDGLDPERDGLAIIEVQRRRAIDLGIHLVGGFVQLTTITQHGASARILRTWPSEYGGPAI